MSPWLFNLFMDKCIRDTCMNVDGVKVGELNVQVLMYADDAIILSDSRTDLERTLGKMVTVTSDMGLKVNEAKTKVMVFEREEQMTECKIEMNGSELEQVSEFVYLGRAFGRNGKMENEIKRRVNAGRRVLGCMGDVVKRECISKEAKIAVYKTVMVPTLLYGSESWVCQKRHLSKVNAVGMDYLRRVCGKNRRDRVRNDWVLDNCGVSENIEVKYDKGMLRWFGHVERMNDGRLTKQIYKAEMEGVRERGRPRKTWLDGVNETFKRRNIRSTRNRRQCMTRCMDIREAREVCQDRVAWRSIVKNVASS